MKLKLKSKNNYRKIYKQKDSVCILNDQWVTEKGEKSKNS